MELKSLNFQDFVVNLLLFTNINATLKIIAKVWQKPNDFEDMLEIKRNSKTRNVQH